MAKGRKSKKKPEEEKNKKKSIGESEEEQEEEKSGEEREESELEEDVEKNSEEESDDREFIEFMSQARRRGAPLFEGVGTFMDEPVFVNLERGISNAPKAGNGNGNNADSHKVKYEGTSFQEEYSSSGQKRYEESFKDDYKVEPSAAELPGEQREERKNLPFQRKADYEPKRKQNI